MDKVSRLLSRFILCLLTFSVPIRKSYENGADATPKAHDEYRREHENASLRQRQTRGWAYENDEPERDSGGRPAYENDAQPLRPRQR